MCNFKVFFSLAAATAMAAYMAYKAWSTDSDASTDEKPTREKPAPRMMASEPALPSAQGLATEPAAPSTMETSTEIAADTGVAAVVQANAHDEAQDDDALDELPPPSAAAVVCENEDAVFLNAAISSSAIVMMPQAAPASSVVCENAVVANTMALTAAEIDDSASAVAMTRATGSADKISDEIVVASASNESRVPAPAPYLASHPLADKYTDMASDWPGLSDVQQFDACMILVRLDAANGNVPFSALRDPMDVVGVVCRSVLRLGDHEAHEQLLSDWFQQYQKLALHGETDAAKVTDENITIQHKLSDWCSDSSSYSEACVAWDACHAARHMWKEEQEEEEDTG